MRDDPPETTKAPEEPWSRSNMRVMVKNSFLHFEDKTKEQIAEENQKRPRARSASFSERNTLEVPKVNAFSHRRTRSAANPPAIPSTTAKRVTTTLKSAITECTDENPINVKCMEKREDCANRYEEFSMFGFGRDLCLHSLSSWNPLSPDGQLSVCSPTPSTRTESTDFPPLQDMSLGEAVLASVESFLAGAQTDDTTTGQTDDATVSTQIMEAKGFAAVTLVAPVERTKDREDPVPVLGDMTNFPDAHASIVPQEKKRREGGRPRRRRKHRNGGNGDDPAKKFGGVEYAHTRVPKTKNLLEEYTGNAVPIPTTTIMIRNIPNRYRQREFVVELNTNDMQGKYDFVYLPMDKSTTSNVGYAFVNFVDEQSAKRAMDIFQGYRFKKYQSISKKIASVNVAHIQGLENNVNHYKESAVNESKIKEHRPLVRPMKPRT